MTGVAGVKKTLTLDGRERIERFANARGRSFKLMAVSFFDVYLPLDGGGKRRWEVMKKMGSLFDGIGGFPLAAQRNGINPVWASEIEKWPIKVTKKHFPGMKHLGNITQINGAEIEPVDIITFGSPCQNLSVAGKQEGLKGEQSCLFYEAIRIIREMRRETNGRYPKYAIWENVPGAFSSNKRQDFRAVLEEITQAEIPMPESGRWANAGMVRGDEYSVAWRILDAQYWGVAQRRRRIFLVADFAGQRAPEILFEQQGVSGDIAESGEKGQETAAGVGDGADGTGLPIWDIGDRRRVLESNAVAHAVEPYPNPANSLLAKANMSFRSDTDNIVRVGYVVRRLTPLECERLMGFPDGWTDIEGGSDTARYKALGNSVAVPCVEFIMQRIKDVK